MLRIGNVQLETPLLLAPIAGYCDLAFRLVVRRCRSDYGGVGLTCTDLLCPQAILSENEKSLWLAATCPEDQPLCMQLYGADPTILAEAARWAQAHGATTIDINMGCPVDKVTKKNGGSKLLCDPASTLQLAKRVVDAVTVPVTAKLRLGWDEDHIVAPTLAPALADVGIAAITIHGRTTQQLFRPSVRLEGVARVVESMKRHPQVPAIGNGDIKCPEDARHMMAVTGCAGVMIGREALAQPWIFRDTAHYLATGQLPTPLSRAQKAAIVVEHFENLLHYRGQRIAVNMINQRISWYSPHLQPWPGLKQDVRMMNSAEQFREYMARGMERVMLEDGAVEIRNSKFEIRMNVQNSNDPMTETTPVCVSFRATLDLSIIGSLAHWNLIRISNFEFFLIPSAIISPLRNHAMPTPSPSNPSSILPAGLPTDQVVPILDFGAQYVQLIARRVREAGVFSILVAPNTPVEELAALKPKGIILSGGPASVYEKGAPTCDPRLFDLGVPVLGICYGMQIGCQLLGAKVTSTPAREFGRASMHITDRSDLLAHVPEQTTVWMSHGDQVNALSGDFKSLAGTPTCPIAAVRHNSRPFYGVQFHPEVTHTPHGIDILSNFLFRICGCAGSWKMSDFLDSQVAAVRRQVGASRVVCGLSGGVDSSVVAALLAKAVGKQLTCIFVDNGLLRKNERTLVESTFRGHFDVDLRVFDASSDFLSDLAGIDDPQEKRRRIGHRFIDVFKRASSDIPDARFLAQGTLYPDVIESGHGLTAGQNGSTANIKLHHNVGGLPAELGFELIEPLRSLFKDEVRKLGEVLGLPEQLVWRHPFPGPGLAVRVLGPVSKEKLDVLREADEILLEEIIANNLYRRTAQVFAVLLPVKAVGVMGDGRTYDNVIAIRAVESQDFMTADWARLPYDVLATISNRIINEVRGVNRVVYDISSKPPATIEWE